MRTSLSILSALTVVAVLLVAPAGAQEAEPTVQPEVVESFDGTGIYTTLFLPAGASQDGPVPIVFRGHGWGGKGERSVSDGSTLDRLLEAGYAVLTWDERGFGDSGDVAHVMSPDFERKDIQVLLDHVAAMPEILTDAPGDPRVGMTGGSYGGGYQLVTAAFDDRIDALAPEITWYDLRYSLGPSDIPKFAWGQLLFNFGLVGATFDGLDPRYNGIETGNYEQELYEIYVRASAQNTFDEDARAYYEYRSPIGYGVDRPIDVPTLVMQGSVDTLFNINEGLQIFEHVRGSGADARYIIFCGGHVSCPSSYDDAGDRDHLDQAILDWFAKHLRGEDVDTGPPVEYRTNEGEWRSLPDLPAPHTRYLEAGGEADLVATAVPTSEGAALTAGPNRPGDPHGASFEVAAAEGGPLEIVGIPRATVELSGSGPLAHVFVKLVDREADEVLNLQEAAIRVEDLSDEPQTFELDLVGVAYTLPEGHHLDLQVSTTSMMHANSRTPAEVHLSIGAEIPVLAAPSAGPKPGGPPDTAAAVGALPATGGGAAPVAVAAMGLAVLARRWASV